MILKKQKPEIFKDFSHEKSTLHKTNLNFVSMGLRRKGVKNVLLWKIVFN